tara:strand:+ start:2989 stop:3942 length:954 start_codon:yes stop_codon:yes gene_type:complete
LTEFIRTPEENFADLTNFNFKPRYHQWRDLRMHYIDEGPKTGPVVLLLHGMPTWSFLYRNMIPRLIGAGYRCIAPDFIGFGRSDKPTDLHWYSITRHTEILTSFIRELNLSGMLLVCQDWGGPIGLAQAVMMPERFKKLVIMNTWLHHEEYQYSPAIQEWIEGWQPGGIFDTPTPDLALMLVMSAGHMKYDWSAISDGKNRHFTNEAEELYRGFSAPYRGLPPGGYNGMRRFPMSIPYGKYDDGAGAQQALHYRLLKDWNKECQFIWGCVDSIFVESWGRAWAKTMNARFDALADADHFLQLTHSGEIVDLICDART